MEGKLEKFMLKTLERNTAQILTSQMTVGQTLDKFRIQLAQMEEINSRLATILQEDRDRRLLDDPHCKTSSPLFLMALILLANH